MATEIKIGASIVLRKEQGKYLADVAKAHYSRTPIFRNADYYPNKTKNKLLESDVYEREFFEAERDNSSTCIS